MFDKYLCHEALLAAGLPSPDTWIPEELPERPPLPLLVKRRWGYASRDIYRCDTLAQVRFFVEYAGVPVIVQRFCPGEQFSIDVLCDLEGKAVNVIPRTMIESKGGESIKGQTIADPRLIDLGKRVAEGLRLVGPATIQCFDEPEGLPVTDVNCRFGGAFPLPLAAGSRYPELVLRIASGEHIEPHVGRFTAGVTMTRYYDTVILPEGDRSARAEPVGGEPILRPRTRTAYLPDAERAKCGGMGASATWATSAGRSHHAWVRPQPFDGRHTGGGCWNSPAMSAGAGPIRTTSAPTAPSASCLRLTTMC